MSRAHHICMVKKLPPKTVLPRKNKVIPSSKHKSCFPTLKSTKVQRYWSSFSLIRKIINSYRPFQWVFCFRSSEVFRLTSVNSPFNSWGKLACKILCWHHLRVSEALWSIRERSNIGRGAHCTPFTFGRSPSSQCLTQSHRVHRGVRLCKMGWWREKWDTQDSLNVFYGSVGSFLLPELARLSALALLQLPALPCLLLRTD